MRLLSMAKAAAFVVLAVAIAGCIPLADPSLDPDPDVPSPGLTTPAPAPAETGASGACAPRPDPTEPRDSLEGAYGYGEMGGYVDYVVAEFITPWLQCTWAQMPPPRDVVYVPRGVVGLEDCLDASGDLGRYTSESYEYCPADQTIYVGQDMLWLFYSRTGDAGPAVGLAHEFGHHIQQMVGIPAPQTTQQSIRHENQADCIAGAWVRFTDQILKVLEPEDDLQDIDTLMPLIGSAEDPDRDHGTVEERVQSFQLGFTQGITACNEFYPTVPLISSG